MAFSFFRFPFRRGALILEYLVGEKPGQPLNPNPGEKSKESENMLFCCDSGGSFVDSVRLSGRVIGNFESP